MILQIALVDLVLSGDNAAVIGMAICRLPDIQRKQAAFWGALLAIILRTLFTVTAALILNIPYLSAIGGALLLYITYKLLFPAHEDENIALVGSKSKLWQAVVVIIAADASMALDNVLGVAGVAAGQPALVCLGLFLSIPILVWGASFVGRLMARQPLILWLGAAVLVHTSLSMILKDSGLGWRICSSAWGETCAWVAAFLVLSVGFFKVKRKR